MEEVTWLDEEEARAWRSFLVMRRVLERGLDRQLTRDAGLSIADYQLLVPLAEAPERALRARDLGRHVDWERSRVSHQIRRMEQRGLIARQDCPTDARGTIIVLTEGGLKAIQEAAPAHVAWVREHFIDLLSRSELETLREISERVVEKVMAEPTLADECPGALSDEGECGGEDPQELASSTLASSPD